MKKSLIILVTLLICSCQKQKAIKNVNVTIKEIDTAYIHSKLAYFTIDNYKIEGEGKNILQEMIDESQFIVFGESHYSKQTSILTKALIPLLSKANFSNFLAEVGPNSAQKLIELSSPFSKTEENMNAFMKKYKHKELGETADPIPFFAGIEDASFLKTIREYKMNLWGIDQEYMYSILFFTDELLKEAAHKENYKEIHELKEKVDEIIFKYLKEDEERKIESALALIEKEKSVIDFFNQFDKNDVKAITIINDLKFSWDIYLRWRKGSHADRISYMRNNLLKIYNKNKNAKMFVKIGSLHASEIISNSAFDIGNLTEELAKGNSTISSSINSWRPFYVEDGKQIDNLKKYSNYYQKYNLFTVFAKENKWIIINLKSIREDIKSNKIKLPNDGTYHGLRKIIDGYDYQLILPEDESITYNLK
ncbi:MAG: hypothetical protein ABJH82_13975 [Polaribacter sp.]|uniref:hypothetical protein n=1 Tax=Polaribacter sp. TaxID=1920175 RepID=UPI003262FDDA